MEMTLMPGFEQKKSRRAFLKGSAAAVVGVTGSAAWSNSGDPLITETQEWASMTGVGVDETPYGLPIGSNLMLYAETWSG